MPGSGILTVRQCMPGAAGQLYRTTMSTPARTSYKQSAVPLQEFWRRMDHLVELNTKLVALGKSGSPFKNLQKAPIVAAMAGEILALYNGKTIRSGSFDLMPETQLAY